MRMKSGYLNDDTFDPTPKVVRMMNSPARLRAGAGETEGEEKPSATKNEAVSPGLDPEALKMIKNRNKRNTDLANRSRQRMQGWLSSVGPADDLLAKVDKIDKSLKAKIDTHLFRTEEKKREISPKKFQVRLKYQTPDERVEYAKAEASVMLSHGTCQTTRKPFVFRAHEPLKHTTKNFQ